jgi:uncharacterized protein (TIGR03086 family)
VRTEYRLLEQAARYALSAAGHATPPLLGTPTPCDGWDLGTLLCHLGDSFDALAEGLRVGSISPNGECCGAEGSAGAPSAPGPPRAPGARGWGDQAWGDQAWGGGELAARAAAMVRACAEVRAGPEPVAVGDRRLTTSVVAITGAIEVAVHGWDVAVSCGHRTPVPAGLAIELLPYAALLVPRHTRPGLFADPVPAPRNSCAGDRLVAFLGRPPGG